MRRRSASAAATTRARDARSSSACRRSSSCDASQRRAETDVVEREADLPRERHQHLLAVLGHCTLDDDQPQQLARAGDRDGPHLRRAPLEHLRQPQPQPGLPSDPGSDHYGLLGGREDQVRAAGVGIRRHPLEHAPGASPHLGGVERERLAQRLGDLQEQLVERERPRDPVTE